MSDIDKQREKEDAKFTAQEGDAWRDAELGCQALDESLGDTGPSPDLLVQVRIAQVLENIDARLETIAGLMKDQHELMFSGD